MINRRYSYARHTGWLLLGLYAAIAAAGISLAYANDASWLSGNPPSRSDTVNFLMFGVWVLVGALLISRKPDNPIGWLFSIGPLFIVLDEFAFGYVYQATMIQPGSLPFVEVPLVWLYLAGHSLFLIPLCILLYVFPTGQPLSSRWERWLRISLVSATVYLLTAAIHPLSANSFPFSRTLVSDFLGLNENALRAIEWVTVVSYFGLLIGIITSVASLLVRLSRSRGVERQQLKWFVFAAGFAAPGFSLLVAGRVMNSATGDLIFNFGNLIINLIFIPGIPIASAIAILRHRLWDIDIIIRRTLSYAVLTAALAALYFGGVVLLQHLFDTLVGDHNSTLITVFSTLAIAALFNPLRTRIQEFIDQRFYRAKYDAEKALADFAVAARDEVDIKVISSRLLSVVAETVQPERANLLLKPPENRK